MRVLTIGTFDLFHEGHQNLLKKCYHHSGVYGELLVGVNTDAFVRKYKKVTPAENELVRMAAVRDSRLGVSHVRLHNGDTPDFIDDCEPDAIAIGSDWGRKDYLGQLGVSWEWLDSREITLIYIPYTPGVSSTQLRDARAKVEHVPLPSYRQGWPHGGGLLD